MLDLGMQFWEIQMKTSVRNIMRMLALGEAIAPQIVKADELTPSPTTISQGPTVSPVPSSGIRRRELQTTASPVSQGPSHT
jgi:hypothetical protein